MILFISCSSSFASQPQNSHLIMPLNPPGLHVPVRGWHVDAVRVSLSLSSLLFHTSIHSLLAFSLISPSASHTYTHILTQTHGIRGRRGRQALHVTVCELLVHCADCGSPQQLTASIAERMPGEKDQGSEAAQQHHPSRHRP